VNTIFKDLATLVHDQGELVDSIEENVSSAQIRVQEGGEQLRLAEHYKVLSFAVQLSGCYCFQYLFYYDKSWRGAMLQEMRPMRYTNCIFNRGVGFNTQETDQDC